MWIIFFSFEKYSCRIGGETVELYMELVDASGALNADFKQRKKDSMPMGLVSHVGDILVHRVISTSFSFFFPSFFRHSTSLVP